MFRRKFILLVPVLLFILGVVPIFGASGKRYPDLKKALVSGKDEPVKEKITDSLSVDANIDARKNTPLIIASRNGHTSLVRWLLDRGADPSIHNKNGLNPLVTAVSGGFKDIVKLLLDHGANPNFSPPVNLNPHLMIAPPLVQAVRTGRTEIARLLIEEGADVNRTDSLERTPLQVASCRGNLEIIRTLVRKNTRIDQGDRYGWTPLMCAFQNGHQRVGEYLLDHGASVNTKNNKGSTALLVTAKSQYFYSETERSPYPKTVQGMFNIPSLRYVELTHTLLKAGSFPNHRDENGNTALHYSTLSGELEATTMLLHFGANPLVRNEAGTSPMRIAYKKDKKSFLDAFTNETVVRPPPESDRLHLELINILEKNGDRKEVRQLLQSGANPNFENVQGWTALHKAVEREEPVLVQQLLRFGANPCRKNKWGLSPLELVKDSTRRGLYFPKLILGKPFGWNGEAPSTSACHGQVLPGLLSPDPTGPSLQ